MRNLFISICSVIVLITMTSCGNNNVKLLLGGAGWDKIAIIDKATKEIEWEYPMQEGWECNSVEYTSNGNILFSYGRGAKLISKEHKEIWNISVPDTCELHTAKELDNGNYLLAICGHPAIIMEVNAKGEELFRTEYETGIENVHVQFRQINKTADGNYMLPLFATSELLMISPKGELIKSHKFEGTPFSSLHIKDNAYWLACGDGHVLLEVDFNTGEVLRRFGADDIEGTRLFFVAALLYSKSGGIYVCNWQGHDRNAAKAESPQVFEMNSDGKICWSLNDKKKFSRISAICEFEE